MDTGFLRKGIVNGWHWRFIAMVVVAIAILEVIAYEATSGAYSFIANGELGMFVVAIMVVQKAKERRSANTLVAVLVSYGINLIFQLTLGYTGTIQHSWGFFAEQNAIIGLIGVFFSIVYSRTTAWSDKRRKELEAKREAERRSKERDEPSHQAQERVHRVKKKQGRGKRP